MSGKDLTKYSSARQRRRHAAVTLEAILVIPILVIVLMGTFVYGSLMTVHHAVMAAATEGAREAAKVPTTLNAADGARVLDAAEAAVEAVLNQTHGLTVATSSGVLVIIEDNTDIDCRGDTTIESCPGTTTVGDAATVRVTVLVKFANSGSFNYVLVPNLLKTVGVDFTGDYLKICSDSRRDCI